MAKEKRYLLEDFSRFPATGVLKNERLRELSGPDSPWLGHALMAAPFEAHVRIDFTGPLGAATGLYYSLAFQLPKWEHFVEKADEWIEVSPVHAQYYQLTMKQKEDLEAKIKAGLGSAAQAVADLELLLHDKRKYEEMMRYMGYRTVAETKNEHKNHSHQPEEEKELCLKVDDDEKTRKEREKRTDNHSLKAMFVDQVDVHTGEGISMRSIVSRWPTLISDFMKLDDNDIDPDKVMKKLEVSRAEAVVLVTKNKLYKEWKNLFLPEVAGRYRRILELVRSRETSVNEYKEWLKPYIARHKLIEEGLAAPERRAARRTSFMTGVGHGLSFAEIVLWVWKDFLSPELQKVPGEEVALHPIDPYDDWTRKNLIFHPDHGLIVKYPWITEEWVQEQIKDIKTSGWLTGKLYYSFIIVTFSRSNYRTATGEEIEDGTFDINLIIMSQNVLLTKLLELKAKQEEFNRYVDMLLGIPHPIHGKRYEPKFGKGPLNRIADALSSHFMLFKRGPYEREWDERLTKYYFAPMAGGRYVPIVNFIKQKIGYGVG